VELNNAAAVSRGDKLAGEYVEEDIRFAVCPENHVSMPLCPNMRNDKAVWLDGFLQSSAHRSYGFGLTYAADHIDQCKLHPDERCTF